MIIACFLAACEQQSPAPVTSDGIAQNVTYPTKLININGWHGIMVTKLKVNTWVECRFSFPTDFGSTQEEKSFLVYLVTQRSSINDKDCQASVVSAYQALDQLLR